MKSKISVVLILLLSNCTSEVKESKYEDNKLSNRHCFDQFLGKEILDLTDSFSIRTDNGGFIIHEVIDTLMYTRKYKASSEGCAIFLDTCFCSGYGKKKLNLIWENDSVCYFAYSAGTGISVDLIINKLDCDKSISGYSIYPNNRGEYFLIDDQDTIVQDIW